MDGRHRLTVDVGNPYAIGIYECQTGHTGTDKSLGAPASDATHAEDNDTNAGKLLHHLLPYQKGGTVINQRKHSERKISRLSRQHSQECPEACVT